MFYNALVFTRIFAVLIVLGLSAAAPLTAGAEQITVLVNPFENQTADRNIDWIGEGLAVLIAERLNAEPRIYVFGRGERVAAFERNGAPEMSAVSRATTIKVAWDIGADVVISGRISGTHDDFRIDARVLDLEQSRSYPEIAIAGRLDNVIPMAAAAARQLALTLVPDSAIPEADYIAQPPIPRSAFEAYVRGVLSSDFQRKLDLLQDAIRLHPQYAAAMFQLGMSYHSDTDYKSSTAMLEKVPSGTLEYLPARFVLAVNYYQLGDYAQAAKVFSDLPQVYDVLVNLGGALLAGGDAEGARSAWERAARLDSLGPEAFFDLAYADFKQGDFELSAEKLEQFLRMQGRDAEALFLLGRAYEQLGRTADAQRVTRQAIRLSSRVERLVNQPLPDLVRLRPSADPVALRFPVPGDLWNPSRLTRRASGFDLPEKLESVRGRIDSQLYGSTIRELQDVVRTVPASPDAKLLLGQVYQLQGQYDLAAREYRAAIALKPSADAYLTLARLYGIQNQMQFAMLAVEEAMKLEPDSPAAAAVRAELERPASQRRRRP